MNKIIIQELKDNRIKIEIDWKEGFYIDRALTPKEVKSRYIIGKFLLELNKVMESQTKTN